MEGVHSQNQKMVQSIAKIWLLVCIRLSPDKIVYFFFFDSLWNLILLFFSVSEELKKQDDILYGLESWPIDFRDYLNRNFVKEGQNQKMSKADFESRLVQFLFRFQKISTSNIFLYNSTDNSFSKHYGIQKLLGMKSWKSS